MAKKKSRRRSYRRTTRTRSTKPTFPIALVLGSAAGVIQPALWVAEGMPIAEAGKHVMRNYTGWNSWNNKFEVGGIMQGLAPLVGGAAVHKLAGMFGVNQTLARARVPFLRI